MKNPGHQRLDLADGGIRSPIRLTVSKRLGAAGQLVRKFSSHPAGVGQ